MVLGYRKGTLLPKVTTAVGNTYRRSNRKDHDRRVSTEVYGTVVLSVGKENNGESPSHGVAGVGSRGEEV